MDITRFILSNYYKILEEDYNSKFLQSKYAETKFNLKDTTDNLLKKHDEVLQNIKSVDILPNQSLLDLKIKIAERIFRKCSFCERKCNVDRTESSGKCKVKDSQISSEFLHFGEESVLVPSYTIFFSGCTFNCVFCQNWDISQNVKGIYVKPDVMATIIRQRKLEGAKNVNWVGGDPTSNLFYILQVLKELDTNIAQVWNSNMYCSEETMTLLDGIIDLYLTDFKYGNDKCAKRLSNVNNYTKIVKRNHKIAYKQTDMIIRHLIMPNHIECCSKPILNWIKNNIPEVCVNIMVQYRPEYKAFNYTDISRSVTTDEYLDVKNYAKNIGLYLI